MATDLDSLFRDVRKSFPHTKEIVYFNPASNGPYSTDLCRSIESYLQMRLDATDDTHAAFGTAAELRRHYAALTGANVREIGLGLNTSFGLNLAAFGLPLKRGDEVLISDIEFPAIAYTFRAAAEKRGFKLKFVPSTNRCFDIDKLVSCITPRSRLLAVSWVQFFNGYRNDLQTLAKICRENDMFFVVDGIQGMGAEPINLHRLGIDIFTSGCQKWMLSPQGCSFFYLSDRVRDLIKPTFMSWLGVDWQVKFTDLFRYDLPWFDSARRFEMGYYAVLNLVGMLEPARLFRRLGIRNIRRHNYALVDRLARYIKSDPYYTITSSMDPRHRSAIFTFTCVDYQQLHRRLLKEKIICVQREGSIRISIHLYNNRADIDRLTGVLKHWSAR